MDSTTSSNKSTSSNKNKKTTEICSNEVKDDNQDQYCWICHKDKCNLNCGICPRSYHLKCINNNAAYSQLESFALLNDKETFIKDNWICFECELISKAESEEGKSECLKRISKDEFCELLEYSIGSIKKTADTTFHQPVNLEIYRDYSDFIVHPMDFHKIEQYVQTKKYSSTESFLSDCKWILHNCYIYNQATNPLTLNARYMLKLAKSEMYELETCPECYRNFYTNDLKDFFIQTCRYPHNLCFAKLKGHPLWPSKVVKYNKQTGEAEVRFFGAHDKAWITLDNCFLLSEKPNTTKVNKNQKNKLENAIRELEAHLELLNKNFPGLFKYHPPKTTLKPDQIYLKAPPNFSTDTPLTTNNLKDVSSINDSLNLENLGSANQPPKKQQTRKSISTPISSRSTVQKLNKPQQQISKEPELNEFSVDSDDENEHKLVIDDPIEDKRRQSTKRKRLDSSSSSKNLPVKNNLVNTNIQTTPIEQEFKSNTMPRKKLKKSLNDSTSTASSVGNFSAQNYQQSSHSNEKIEQLVKQVQYLKDELDRVRGIHIAEIKEMFENHKSGFRELKNSMEADQAKALSSLRKELEQKHAKQVEEIKRKSWCTNCLKQASYFCCRLASYCSYECQSQHWVSHMPSCLQNKEKPAETTCPSNETEQQDLMVDKSKNKENTESIDKLDNKSVDDETSKSTDKVDQNKMEIDVNLNEKNETDSKLDKSKNVNKLIDEITNERNDEVKQEKIKKDEPKKDDAKKDELKQIEVKKDEVKREEIKKEEVKIDEIKKDEVKKEEIKKEEVKKEEVKKDDVKKDEPKKDDVKKDELKQNEIKQEEIKSPMTKIKFPEKPKDRFLKRERFFSNKLNIKTDLAENIKKEEIKIDNKLSDTKRQEDTSQNLIIQKGEKSKVDEKNSNEESNLVKNLIEIPQKDKSEKDDKSTKKFNDLKINKQIIDKQEKNILKQVDNTKEVVIEKDLKQNKEKNEERCEEEDDDEFDDDCDLMHQLINKGLNSGDKEIEKLKDKKEEKLNANKKDSNQLVNQIENKDLKQLEKDKKLEENKQEKDNKLKKDDKHEKDDKKDKKVEKDDKREEDNQQEKDNKKEENNNEQQENSKSEDEKEDKKEDNEIKDDNLSDLQLSIQSDVSLLKDDLIKMVENELDN